MDSRPCWVLDEEDAWPGTVLAWQPPRDGAGWRALVRFRRPQPDGYPLTYEHWLPAETLAPRDSDQPPSAASGTLSP